MVRKQKTQTIIVSHLPRRRSRSNKSHHSSIRKKRFENVIHTTSNGSTNSDLRSMRYCNSTEKLPARTDELTNIVNVSKSSRKQNQKNRRTNENQSIEPSHKLRTEQVSHRTALAENIHPKMRQKKTKICSLDCSMLSLIIIMGIIAIVVPVLIGLLLNSTTDTKSKPLAILRWNTKGITVAGITASAGNARNQLSLPSGIELDWNNNLYIADYSNHRVQRYFSNGFVDKTVAGNGTGGTSSSQLKTPDDVLLDFNGSLYVSDSSNYRIQLWQSGATNGTTIAGVTGISGFTYDKLNNPFGMAVDATSNALYIADYNNHRVMSYSRGANNGTLILGGQGGGINRTQLYLPAGLVYDSFSNSLFIANCAAHNVVQYVLGATSWALVAGNSNGIAGLNSTSFRFPSDVALDPMGNIYVADYQNHRIQYFPDGSSNGVTIAGATGVNGSNATLLDRPWSLKLDNQLDLYVADTYNHRVQKFLRY